MRKKQSFTVEKPDAGKRIDVFIHEKLPSLSRNQIKGIIQAGLLKRAYKTVANFGEKISENELIQIDYDPEENYKYRAKKLERKIEVVADTPDYIVFEKDFNVPSFSRRKNEKTAFQYINDYVKQKSNKRFNQVFPVVSPDKYIAGLMCVAKTENVQKSLSGNQ
ncbi:MAG: hypothetical protein KDD94_07845, partial [Calditrichaeota bacterium]|nr:hypothetical protein [Calditrichota bacterium]